LVGQYATETLSLESLNYHDRHTVSKLQEACKHTDFYLCFVGATRHASGLSHKVEVDEPILHGFVDLDGSRPHESLRLKSFGKHSVLDEDAWSDEEPDEEEWGDPHYEGHDDYVSRQWERTVSYILSAHGIYLANKDTQQMVLFMPRRERMSFFLDRTCAPQDSRERLIEGTIDRFLKQVHNGSISAETRDDLIQICKLFASHHTRDAYPSSVTSRLKTAAAKLDHKSLLAALSEHRELYAGEDKTEAILAKLHNIINKQKRRRDDDTSSQPSSKTKPAMRR
jgi:hypothetical protein